MFVREGSLTAKADLNGCFGTVVANLNPATGRIPVIFWHGGTKTGPDASKEISNNTTRRPCFPSDMIVVYMSPVIAGTPPASSSGRGRGYPDASRSSVSAQGKVSVTPENLVPTLITTAEIIAWLRVEAEAR